MTDKRDAELVEAMAIAAWLSDHPHVDAEEAWSEASPFVRADYINAQMAALAAIRAAGWYIERWQPIETAPKDRAVLVSAPSGQAVCFWLNDHWNINGVCRIGTEPTCWMPLPQQPETKP